MSNHRGRIIGTWAVLAALGLFVPGVRAADAPPQPATKDSPPFGRPPEATFTTRVVPDQAKPGDTVRLEVAAKIKPPWHIYTYAKEQPGLGPRNTEFDFFDRGGLKVLDDWKPSKPPVRKKEPAFPNLETVEFHENEVTWSISLQVPTDAVPGTKTLKVQAYYQICDPTKCSRPGRWTLPEAKLTVLSADAAGPNAAAQAAPPAVAEVTPNPAPEPPSVSAPAPDATSSVPTPEATAPAAPPVNDVQKALQGGLLPFLALSVAGGLLALAMPCVWPMVPVTVNFFVKQGQKNKGQTTGLAITYSLAIIGIFTAFGVLCAFFFEASSLKNLANDRWLNTAVALLFLAFGLSLLGLFELRLPSFVLNASVQGESRGGLIGVIFMALTLTITSFTCTFPVVGGLLVMAAGGSFLYPIIGLMTFASVVALPFFLLAMAPGLLSRMPKSGDWMNTIKVVGGLIEIGAAFKFLNTAEIGFGATPEEAWFDAQLVLAIWVVLAMVCGIYLLGLFKTDHDHDEVKIGPARILAGSAFLCLALYVAPALFGLPPKSRAYEYFVVGLLPPDSSDLRALGGAVAAGEADGGVIKATSADPKVAQTQEKRVHGVVWGMSYEAALEQARAEGKPILIDFTGVNCANCRLMEQRVLPRPEVVPLLEKFVTIQLYTDYVPISTLPQAERQELGDINFKKQEELTQDATNPIYVALSPQGEVLGRLGGYREPPVFVQFLESALARQPKSTDVALAEPTR